MQVKEGEIKQTISLILLLLPISWGVSYIVPEKQRELFPNRESEKEATSRVFDEEGGEWKRC
jgi:hypothetical protein